MADTESITVEVAYALPHSQRIVELQVAPGTTARQAVLVSGIEKTFPEIDLQGSDLGIFGKSVKDEYELLPGDRVEIYRPLIADPKESRKQRAARAKSAKQ